MTVVSQTADGWKEFVVRATGPAADVSVGAGASADLELTYAAPPLSRIEAVRGVVMIAGLPDGLVIQGFTPEIGRIVIRVRNTTAAAITVAAGSVTADVEVLGY